ncbi:MULTISPECIES: hypothetical protein [unclassified Streptomyces]|uniref:hypothetical protein n=1 Tax=unclassified Streptomyces TaxID=2593676 RepID=UPI002E8214AC|nr:hypothetical protein [Streptomyces sp. NBC_00589]WTI35933.1 hypothetical protein OIC96_13470 [Streptomyces sp. NBC_00775]WUB30393.1 hypothetical protein OHA51_36260 [Streptomyces sp. NBC_00589]
MPALATRPRRLALACALITAATLGTVSASAASASDTSTTPTVSAGSQAPKGTKPPKGAGFAVAVAYTPTSNAPDDVNTANGDFAACMREQGQETFPDFHAAKDEDGAVRLLVRLKGDESFDPAAKSYRNALVSCAPILKKAGITFPAEPGLPPLPEPGKKPPYLHKEKGAPGLHTEQGGSDEPDLPSLSSVTEKA